VPQHRVMAPMARFEPEHGVTVKAPERGEAGYWVGCPGILYEPDRQRFLLTYRERRPGDAEPCRGWRCAVAASSDGVRFEDLWEVRKEDLGTPSMERFSLIRADGCYRLYTSYVDPADGRWRIDVMEAAEPGGFRTGSARPALTATQTGTEGVKDPYVLQAGPVTYMFASYAAPRVLTAEQWEQAHRTGDIYDVGVTTLPTGLATSLDGLGFRWRGTALDVGDRWDRYQARLTCVVPIASGYLGFYDGSADVSENFEERCGIAVSGDLWRWHRVTADESWTRAPHGSGSVRYLDVLPLDGEWWIYYELARADGAHELRLQRLPVT
jgi:hypothetical protein